MPTLIERFRSRNRREKMVLGGAAGVVVLLLAYMLLSGGGGEPEALPRVPRTHVTPTPRPAAPETNEVFVGRDPFIPLVQPSSSAAPGTGGTSGPPGTGGTGTAAQRLSLLDIATQNGARTATVQVDDQQYTVSMGETFATSYQLIDLTSRCGTFSVGDERFTRCLTTEARK